MHLKTIILTALTVVISGCSSITDVFVSDHKKPLKGERISVLELQKSLQPDKTGDSGIPLSIPKPWKNEFWPQAGGYPNHSMQHLAFNPDSLKLKWRADIGAGTTDEIPLTAQPIIVGGLVYTLDTRSNVSAFNTDDGKRVWRVNIRDPEEDDPVIGGGLSYAEGLIFATNGYDELVTLDPKTGNISWRREISAPSRAAPTIMEGRVFVTTLDNRLLAFDVKNGTPLWEHVGLSETAGLVGAASAAANRDIVVPAFSSGELNALRVENGSVAWSDNLSNLRRTGGLAGLSDIRALPVIDKGLVIAISFSGRLVAIDERTGQRVWQREISGSETPWVVDAHIFVLSEDNELVALSRETGLIRWVRQLPRYQDPEDRDGLIRWSGPVLAGGRLILVSNHEKMLEVQPQNGEVIAVKDIARPVNIAPVVAGGVLYLLGEDGSLMAYE